MSEVKSFIQDLKRVSESENIKIFVPSLKKNVSFKSLSVKQHQDLIKTLLDGVEGPISVFNVFNNIIRENSLADIEFLLQDRNKILLDMRKQIVGTDVTIKDAVYSLNDLPSYEFEPTLTETITYNDISVDVSIPTLDLDTKITEKCVSEITKINRDDNKMGKSVSILLIYELMKFIQKIKMPQGEISFSDIGTYDKKSIIESLPVKLNNRLISFISKYKEEEQRFYTFDDGTKLTIDVGFLTGE